MGSDVSHGRAAVRGFDREAFAEVIAGGRFDHELLHDGPVTADLERLSGPGLSIDRGFYGFATHVRGDFDPEMLCFGMVRAGPGSASINGRRVLASDLQVYAEGATLDYTAGPQTGWMGLQVRREDLLLAGESAGLSLRLPTRGDANLRLESMHAESIARCVRSVLEDASAGQDPRAGRHALLTLLALAVARAQQAGRDDAQGASGLVMRAINLMRQAPSAGYESAPMCEALGVSERSLQLAFRRTLGLSPSRCSELLRLRRAHEALVNAVPGGSSVTSIALRYGFTHMGRFARRYAEVFGQAPSTTLRAGRVR